MNNANDLLKLIKQAAIEAVQAANPVSVCRGSVESVSPLSIKIDQKLTLSGKQLEKCKEIGEINKADTVILLREQGGQKYIILGVI